MNDPHRLERKREKTRNALVDAARCLVYERQDNRISIQDITDRAGVGLGTFYNYFESKQFIFEAVLEEIHSNFERELNALREPLSDPATIVSTTLQYSFQQCQDNEEWRTFIVYSGLEGDHILHQNEEQCFLDIQRGASGGRFKVEDVHFASNLIMGMFRHVSNEIRLGNLSRAAMQDTTRYILRMLGIPDLAAKALTQASLWRRENQTLLPLPLSGPCLKLTEQLELLICACFGLPCQNIVEDISKIT